MRLLWQTIGAREELTKIHLIHMVHGLLLLVALTHEWSSGDIQFIAWLGNSLVLALFYNLYLKTLKQLFYSYWTFSILLGFYMLIKLFGSLWGELGFASFLLNFAALCCLVYGCYLISSPLYYPRVTWWEYDFRYRGDLKVSVAHNSKQYEARLTDLRRSAGCVVMFENIEVGESIEIYPKELHAGTHFTAEVVSKRENVVARGIQYGVRIIFQDHQERRQFEEFSSRWNQHKTAKRSLKFSEGSDEVQ